MARKINDGLTAQQRYDRKSCIGVHLKLNLTTDADILRRLEEVGNKQGYIKALIRADMQNADNNSR